MSKLWTVLTRSSKLRSPRRPSISRRSGSSKTRSTSRMRRTCSLQRDSRTLMPSCRNMTTSLRLRKLIERHCGLNYKTLIPRNVMSSIASESHSRPSMTRPSPTSNPNVIRSARSSSLPTRTRPSRSWTASKPSTPSSGRRSSSTSTIRH
jgi:hypothetical protein